MFDEEEISKMFGIPAEMLKALDHSSYVVALEEANRAFIELIAERLKQEAE